MVSLITDPELEERLIAQRRASGADRYDEVWEGVYVMSPLANNEHQWWVTKLSSLLDRVIGELGLGSAYAGVNVTDQEDNWEHNFRCPDVAVFLQDTKALDRGTHWFGGPDLAIEVVSPHDRSMEKLSFYAKVGVRELLIVARSPWALDLYRLRAGELEAVGRSTLDDGQILASEVVPLSWQLSSKNGKSVIQVRHHDGQQEWTIGPFPN